MSTSPAPNKFQLWLHSQCSELGISQRDLRHQLNVSRSTMRSWWVGRSVPTAQNTYKIIRSFEILGDCEIDVDALPFSVSSCATDPGSPFGHWLLLELNRNRTSLFRLSGATGIQEETLRQWILGNVQPSLLNFMKVVELFCDGRPGEFILGAYEAILEGENENG